MTETPMTEADRKAFEQTCDIAGLHDWRDQSIAMRFFTSALTYARAQESEELAKLRAENERFGNALKNIVHIWGEDSHGNMKSLHGTYYKDIARDALAASPAPAVNPDDAAVDRFATAMKTKLSRKRAEGRVGWEDKAQCTQGYLSNLLINHVEKGDPVDVGNLAMMLHQRGERICND